MAFTKPFRKNRAFMLSAFASVVVLSGCANGLSLPSIATPAPTGTTTETVTTDVAAPDTFSISDKALWDGRPTFGGVWMAYPDIDQPERVRITNPDNGKTVIGALYKRERDFPGPKIELSADAAAALGVLAGNPTALTVVALVRRDVQVEVTAPADPLAPPSDIPVPPQRAADSRPVAAPESAVAQQEPVVATPAPKPEPPVVAADIAAEVGATIAATPLPPVAGAPARVDTGYAAFIQVATLQIKSNAEAVRDKLMRAGLEVEIRERQAGGKTLYRMIVGPANSPDALKIMLETVHKLGFKDAFKLG